MINPEKMIKGAKMMLGAPIINIELSDEQMYSLICDAKDSLTLYSTIANLKEKDYMRIESMWIKKYFYALCKESLGRILGKYDGNLSIPGSYLKLNYKNLIIESSREKKFLRYIILKDKNILNDTRDEIILIFYINVGNLEYENIEEYTQHFIEKLDDNNNFIKYFIPCRDQKTRIECIYPVGLDITQTEEGKKLIEKMNDHFFKDIEEKEDGIIGRILSLDLGSTPVKVEVIKFTKEIVTVKYLNSTPGRIEEFKLEEFEALSGMKIK